VDVAVEDEGGVVILQPSGRIDSEDVQELQRTLNDLLARGERSMIVDLAETLHLGGAGIRLLLTLGKKLGSRGGGLVLCRLGDDLKRSFDVAGVAGKFNTVGSRHDAVRTISEVEKISRLSDEAARLLASPDDTDSPE
jgi:anti-anti-sigma factor